MAIGIMEVTLIKARGLKNTEFLGRVDPYVVLEYRNQQHKSNSCRKKKASKYCMPHYCVCLRGQGVNPVWNEKFKFRVEYPLATEEDNDQKHHKLILKIMDRDTFTDDDYLGQATIYLKDLFAIGVENGQSELHPQAYRVVSSNDTYHGEIQVGITFTVEGELPNQQEHGGKESQK